MARRRQVSPRLAAALLAALSVTPVALARPVAAVAAPAAASRAGGLDAARARVDAARARVDAVSAELAGVRAQMYAAEDPAERGVLEADERQLQDRKDTLLERLSAEETALAKLVADRGAAAQADDGAKAVDPGTPAADPSGSPVVILPGLAEAAALVTSGALGTTAPPVQTVTPATPLGDDAAARLDAYLAGKGSPLAGQGATFVAEAQRAGLDPRFLVAISGAETSFGTYGPSQLIFNPFGLGPGMRFASWADAIARAAQNLAGRFYLAEGRVTIAAIQQRWAPDGATNDPTGLNSNWTRNVSRYYAELGGNPAAPVFTGVSAADILTQPVLPTVGASGAQAAEDALRLLGVPHPADRAGGLDDAALVQVVYAKNGISLPPTAAGQAERGTAVEPTALQAGDALFFSTPDGVVTHAGLYLGDGQFVHAPGPGDTVGIASLYEAQWAQAYAGARRF